MYINIIKKTMTYKYPTPVTSACETRHMGPHDIGSDVEEDL